MKHRYLPLVLALAAGVIAPVFVRADDQAAAISPQARGAITAMGKSLAAQNFSFKDMTIREYVSSNGQPLHIFHHAAILVRRPDHLAVDIKGDDGNTKIAYDGKTLIVYGANLNKFASVPASGSIEAMLKIATTRLGMDFPLADFLVASPGNAFLAGITFGYEVNTVPIGGVPCRHLLFMEPPGIELELWVEKNPRAVPRRLIVTYRSLPGEPRFIAEMWGWNLAARSTDADFALHLPAGAVKMQLAQEKPQ